MVRDDQFITKMVLLVVIGILALYNTWTVNHGTQQTISGFVKEMSVTRPWIPLIAGFIMGHLFWTEK